MDSYWISYRSCRILSFLQISNQTKAEPGNSFDPNRKADARSIFKNQKYLQDVFHEAPKTVQEHKAQARTELKRIR